MQEKEKFSSKQTASDSSIETDTGLAIWCCRMSQPVLCQHLLQSPSHSNVKLSETKEFLNPRCYSKRLVSRRKLNQPHTHTHTQYKSRKCHLRIEKGYLRQNHTKKSIFKCPGNTLIAGTTYVRVGMMHTCIHVRTCARLFSSPALLIQTHHHTEGGGRGRGDTHALARAHTRTHAED